MLETASPQCLQIGARKIRKTSIKSNNSRLDYLEKAVVSLSLVFTHPPQDKNKKN